MKKILLLTLAATTAYAATQLTPLLSVSSCSPSVGDTVTFSAVYPPRVQRQVDPTLKANSIYAEYPANPIFNMLCYDTNSTVTVEVLQTFENNQRRMSNGWRSFVDVGFSGVAGSSLFCQCALTHLVERDGQIEQDTEHVIYLNVGQ